MTDNIQSLLSKTASSKYEEFLIGTLGLEGARALCKSTERISLLEPVILPRTILSWLQIIARTPYFSSNIPGINSNLSLHKNEDNTFTGHIIINNEKCSFDNVNLYHVAASVAVAMEIDEDKIDTSIKSKEMKQLGKSIDLLVKMQAIKLHKIDKPGPAAPSIAPQGPQGAIPPKEQSDSTNIKRKKKLDTTPAPAPAAPRDKVAKIPKIKLPKIKIGKHTIENSCNECDQKQFYDGKLKGCLCFRELAKNTQVEKIEDYYIVSFGNEWDAESLAVFLEIFEDKNG